jgi:hypothetical protein
MSRYQQQILSSFAKTKPRTHAPRFHVERDRVGWRLFDGDTAIGLFLNRGWLAFDLWSSRR